MQLMRLVPLRGWMLLAAVALAPTPGLAQGAKVFCIPNTQACFSAQFGFVPTPGNPFYQNRFSSVITNLQGTYGGLNTPYGFLGLGFTPRWDANLGPRATIGWFDLPSMNGKLATNPYAPGFDFNQPGGSSGYMTMRGSGYLGCARNPNDATWTFAGCPPDGRDGGVAFDMDLSFYGLEGTVQPASFRHFALYAITTEGSCTFTPSSWLVKEKPGDACEERTLSTSTMTASMVGATVAPEPGTLVLLGSGLTGLALRFRRRRVAARRRG